jgi:hypothetical protein
MQISDCFLWFLVMVVTSSNSQPANITCKFTAASDICCPVFQQKDEIALREAARIFAQCLVNNTQQYEAGDFINETEGIASDQLANFTCLVSDMKMDQPEIDTPENKDILQGSLHNYESDERFIETYEDFNKCSLFLCSVANFRDILLFRYNNTHCDDKYRYNAPEAQRICEEFFNELKDGRYIKNCVNVTESLRHSCVKIFLDINNCNIHLNTETRIFPFIPRALKSKEEEIYFGISLREVGGITGFVILSSIYVTGLVLNCILIRIFIRHEEMRKDSKLIIINIAIADILNLVLHSPPIDTFLVNSIHSPLSVTYVFYMIVGLNIYSVMMFSCHIYLTVLPVKNRRNSGCSVLRRYSPHAHALTAAVLACLVPVPLTSVLEEYYTVSLYVLIAYCAVPLCCSTLFSVGTSLRLGSCVQSVHCGSSDHETLRGPRSKSANTLVALIVVSAVSYVPYFSLPFVPPYIGEESDDHSFLIPWVFVWFNSFVNPIALYVANKDFRYYFNKYICCCCCSGRE